MTKSSYKTLVQTDIIHLLKDYKAKDITVLDVRKITDITDYMIICTGNSDRHIKTLTEHIVSAAKKKGATILGIEGKKEGEWVLIDLIEITVHIMLSQKREFYNLEKLWGPPSDPL